MGRPATYVNTQLCMDILYLIIKYFSGLCFPSYKIKSTDHASIASRSPGSHLSNFIMLQEYKVNSTK